MMRLDPWHRLGQSMALSIKNALSSGKNDQVQEMFPLDEATTTPPLSYSTMCVVLSAHAVILLTFSGLVS
jgi:hypothetical protein